MCKDLIRTHSGLWNVYIALRMGVLKLRMGVLKLRMGSKSGYTPVVTNIKILLFFAIKATNRKWSWRLFQSRIVLIQVDVGLLIGSDCFVKTIIVTACLLQWLCRYLVRCDILFGVGGSGRFHFEIWNKRFGYKSSFEYLVRYCNFFLFIWTKLV